MPDPIEPEEREWFCPECGIIVYNGVSYDGAALDADGCCMQCGNGCCRMSQLRALLGKAGLHLVTDADKAVLDAMVNVSTGVLRFWAKRGFRGAWAVAELARRGEKA